jgi:hypothetical protein
VHERHTLPQVCASNPAHYDAVHPLTFCHIRGTSRPHSAFDAGLVSRLRVMIIGHGILEILCRVLRGVLVEGLGRELLSSRSFRGKKGWSGSCCEIAGIGFSLETIGVLDFVCDLQLCSLTPSEAGVLWILAAAAAAVAAAAAASCT